MRRRPTICRLRARLPTLPPVMFLSVFALASNHAPCAAAVEHVSPALLLPPAFEWTGTSEGRVVEPGDPWITPCEESWLEASPSYSETMRWIDRLVAASPQLERVSIGKSHQGRDIVMIVGSREGASSARGLAANGRPTLLVQAGIHAGEIDGKDAGMMLLRDLTVGGRDDSLERVNLLFIPILNPDGHERRTPYSRVNQRGPSEMGWRTNARNQNLNRDFTKLDTPEVRALVSVLNAWSPTLYVDIHVTDGIDYQYDVTWGYNGQHGWSPAIAEWLDRELTPRARDALEAAEHVPGQLVFAVDRHDPAQGIFGWTAGPRFSNGYGDARHLATVLVENHSLKPYPRRVLGTYTLLRSVLATLSEEHEGLERAATADRDRRPSEVALAWRAPRAEPKRVEFLGVASELRASAISGGLVTEWQGRPQTLSVPLVVATEAAVSARRPAAYWVPAPWSELIERLSIHGVVMERIDGWTEVEVELYRLVDPEFDPEPFEGRMRVKAQVEPTRLVRRMPPGSVRVSTDQPLGTLAALLLEPESPDSFFQWGFLLEVLQRTEYAEAYAMEPLAAKMLEESSELREAFHDRLQNDPDFAGSPRERLQWFYERTPYFDADWRLYPIGREIEPAP